MTGATLCDSADYHKAKSRATSARGPLLSPPCRQISPNRWRDDAGGREDEKRVPVVPCGFRPL